mmetsp:Transcript_3170/g.7010  ORF Transcript_3170/g.7010 Transcript_3170/m.7010 type:complete len:253 (+) Transcript_3170:1488-2246(+)
MHLSPAAGCHHGGNNRAVGSRQRRERLGRCISTLDIRGMLVNVMLITIDGESRLLHWRTFVRSVRVRGSLRGGTRLEQRDLMRGHGALAGEAGRAALTGSIDRGVAIPPPLFLVGFVSIIVFVATFVALGLVFLFSGATAVCGCCHGYGHRLAFLPTEGVLLLCGWIFSICPAILPGCPTRSRLLFCNLHTRSIIICLSSRLGRFIGIHPFLIGRSSQTTNSAFTPRASIIPRTGSATGTPARTLARAHGGS